MNSASLAASFVLVLPQPVPVSMSIINHIQMVTGKKGLHLMSKMNGFTNHCHLGVSSLIFSVLRCDVKILFHFSMNPSEQIK